MSRLTVADARTTLLSVISTGGNNDADFLPMLNQVQERFFTMGRWTGMEVQVDFSAQPGYITLPRGCESALGARIRTGPAPIFGRFHEFMGGGPGLIQDGFAQQLLVDQGAGFATAIDLPAPSQIKVVSTATADTGTISLTDSVFTPVLSGNFATVEISCVAGSLQNTYFTLCGEPNSAGSPLVFIYRVNGASVTYPTITGASFQVVDIATGATGPAIATATANAAATFGIFQTSSAGSQAFIGIPDAEYFGVNPSSVGGTGFTFVNTPGVALQISESVTPGYTSLKAFTNISSVIKPVSTGSYLLFAVDLVTAAETLVASYAPGETSPSYRRYKITASDTTDSVSVLCKREYVPCVADTDEVVPANLGALKLGLLALNYEDHGDVTRAAASWGAAVELLNGGLKEKRGGIQSIAQRQGLGVGRLRQML